MQARNEKVDELRSATTVNSSAESAEGHSHTVIFFDTSTIMVVGWSKPRQTGRV